MKKVSIIYWSGTGNTEVMAEAISKGAKDAGAEVTFKSVSEASLEDIKNSDVLALGCPSMGSEQLEECEMEPFIESIKSIVSGKSIALFGSYGWGDGQWMRDWCERMEQYGANLINEGLIVNEVPDEDSLKECEELGKNL